MEDEWTDEQFQLIAGWLAHAIDAEDAKPHILNPARLKEMDQAYQLAEIFAKETGLKVSVEMNTPLKSAGIIRLEGKPSLFKNCQLFTDICRRATTVAVNPHYGRDLEIEVIFYGIAVPLEVKK